MYGVNMKKILLFLLAIFGNIVFAQSDKAGGKDYSLVPKMQDFYLKDYKYRDFENEKFNRNKKNVEIEGVFFQNSYEQLKSSSEKHSRLQIIKNYSEQFKQSGSEIIYESQSEINAIFNKNGKDIWVKVYANNDNHYTVSIVEKQKLTEEISKGKFFSDKKDKAGYKDYVLVPRLNDFILKDYKEKDFDSYKFERNEKKVEVEGRYIELKYTQNSNSEQNRSRLQIARNYSAYFKKIGAEITFENNAEVQAIVAENGKEVWIKVYAHNDINYSIYVIEKQGLKSSINSNDLYNSISTTGKAILYINFEAGKADISAESESVIEEVAKMLSNNNNLSLSVEGHTDNTGSPEGNLELSQLRAQKVKEAIVEKGIKESRLSAKGFGRTKPIAENDTDEGRAKNRRVELVKN